MPAINQSTRDTKDIAKLGISNGPYATDRLSPAAVTVERKPNGEVKKIRASYPCSQCGCNHTVEVNTEKP